MLQIAVLLSKIFFLKTAALNTRCTRCFHAAVRAAAVADVICCSRYATRFVRGTLLGIICCQPATETARRMYILS